MIGTWSIFLFLDLLIKIKFKLWPWTWNNNKLLNDHVSYVSGSDDGLKIRMKLFFDENYVIVDKSLACYYKKAFQFESSPEDILYRLQSWGDRLCWRQYLRPVALPTSSKWTSSPGQSRCMSSVRSASVDSAPSSSRSPIAPLRSARWRKLVLSGRRLFSLTDEQ